MSPLHVLMVDASDRGGIARYTDHLADGLRARSVTVSLAAGGERATGPLRLRGLEWGAGSGASAWRRLVFYVRRVPQIVLAAASLLRAQRATAAEVVHVHTPITRRADHLLFPIVRRRSPVVLTVHNVVPHEHQARERRLDRRRWRAVDLLVVHGEEAASVVRADVPDVPVQVVDVDLIGGLTGLSRAAARRELGQGDGPLCLMLGLVRPYKGFGLMADAWPTVHDAVPDATLAIVGELPEDFAEIRRLRSQPAVLSVLRWLSDWETELWAAAADVCLLPYDHGAHSGVLHRAVANGTPCIAAPCLAAEATRYQAGPVVPLRPERWSAKLVEALTVPLPPPRLPGDRSLAEQMLPIYQQVIDRRACVRSART